MRLICELLHLIAAMLAAVGAWTLAIVLRVAYQSRKDKGSNT